jgi:prepilin-type processing-associated H-X9-DG protein
MYSDDFDGKLPDRDAWMDLTKPYNRGAPGDEHCSSFRDPNLYGYSLNAGVNKDDEPSPATRPLIYESVNLARNASDLFTSLPVGGRHDGRNVVGYLDGHVKALIVKGAAKP